MASAVPPERKKAEPERPKLAPALPFIDTILEAIAGRRASSGTRRIASGRDCWRRSRRCSAESTVREFVRQRKAAMGLLGHEVLVPQSYQFGGEAQVDWYEIWAEFDGQPRKVYISACARWHRAQPFTGPIRTPHSRRFSKPTNWRSHGLVGSFISSGSITWPLR